jgi:uncharacterized membrane protein YeaQ/YmgE (transglycosylase-associated protein family)
MENPMELQELAILILTGAVAGWLAGAILKKGGFSIIGNIVVGVVGAFIGGWLFGLLKISFGEKWIGSFVTATVGAVVLLLVAGLVQKKK